MGAPRLPHRTRTSAIFGKTADYVLRNAPLPRDDRRREESRA